MKFTVSLKKNYQFRYVYNKGKSLANKLLIVYIRKNGSSQNRLGISVSKKVGNSVARSRVTRLIRESYRLAEENASAGFDIVVIAREAAKASSFWEIDSALKHMLKKHNIWIKNVKQN